MSLIIETITSNNPNFLFRLCSLYVVLNGLCFCFVHSFICWEEEEEKKHNWNKENKQHYEQKKKNVLFLNEWMKDIDHDKKMCRVTLSLLSSK